MFAEKPSGWPVRKLKQVAQIQSSNVDKKADPDETPVRLCNYTDVYYNEEINDALTLMKATATPDEIQRFGLRPGDVLLTKDSESWDDIGVPAHVAEPIEDGVCGYHLAQLRPRSDEIAGAFLSRALSARGVREQFHVRANGITRYGLTLNDMGEVLVPVPPLSTQRAIAAFLDHETAKIDDLIDKKRRLLGLLDEKRTALITRAVTRGLHSDVPMKDSGVEWLGEIPAHWDVCQLRHLGHFASGSAITSASIEERGEYPVYGGNGLRGFTDEYTHEGSYVIVGRQGAHSGNVHLAEGKFWASEHAVVGDPHRQVDCHWLAALLRAMNLNQYAEAAAQPGLAVSEVISLRAPLPPIREQARIASRIGNAARVDQRLQGAVSDAISLLQEYRTALISAAVTGQIDVREVAA